MELKQSNGKVTAVEDTVLIVPYGIETLFADENGSVGSVNCTLWN